MKSTVLKFTYIIKHFKNCVKSHLENFKAYRKTCCKFQGILKTVLKIVLIICGYTCKQRKLLTNRMQEHTVVIVMIRSKKTMKQKSTDFEPQFNPVFVDLLKLYNSKAMNPDVSIMADTPINVYARFCQSTAKSKFSLISPVAD